MVGSAESVPGKVMESVIMNGLGALDIEGLHLTNFFEK